MVHKKKKTEKLDQVKIKNVCSTNNPVQGMKRQPTGLEKIFPNGATDKWQISKLYKQLIQPNINKPSNPIQKWAEDLNRHFCREDIQNKQQAREKMPNVAN